MTVGLNRNAKKIISLNIDLIDYSAAIAEIVARGRDRKPGYACFANVHMVIEAYHDEAFASDVNKAEFVFADGMPLVQTLKLFYDLKQDRIAGMDLMPDLIKQAEFKQLKIYFFGTTPEVLEKIRLRIIKEHPMVEVVGLVSPPFDRSLDDASYIEDMNSSGANLVFVALGCPKQEKWMATHSHKINATLLGVGGAFPVYAGVSARAPRFMRNAGLEWLYRLFQEPGRLFRRYLMTNSLFIYLVFKIKLKRLFGN